MRARVRGAAVAPTRLRGLTIQARPQGDLERRVISRSASRGMPAPVRRPALAYCTTGHVMAVTTRRNDRFRGESERGRRDSSLRGAGGNRAQFVVAQNDRGGPDAVDATAMGSGTGRGGPRGPPQPDPQPAGRGPEGRAGW